MKIEMRGRGRAPSSISGGGTALTTWAIRPSAGATTMPSRTGVTRTGSRKNRAHQIVSAVPIQPSTIYAQMCVRCHGAEGHGDPEIKNTMPNVRDFADPTFQAQANYEQIARVIMAGSI